VFRHAVTRLIEALRGLEARTGRALTDVDLFCLHQANARINAAVAEQLGLPPDRVAHNIERYGNTTAATIPLLLDEAVRSGQLRPGQTTALAAFGSGFTWGAALVTL
jgi:3-oxoacyl-[acyl-carrier-protein] synthase-3